MIKKFILHDKQKDLDYEICAKLTEGYSGSDIRLVCKETLMKGVRRTINYIEKNNINNMGTNKIDLITNEDFKDALDKTRPASLYKSEQYIKWMESFGSF